MPGRDLDGPHDDLGRDLHLGDEHARPSDSVGSVVDVIGSEAAVRARGDRDRILPIRRDGYEGGARGRIRRRFEQARIDAFVGERLHERLAEPVVAHAAQERHVGAEEGGGGGLVGPLAAVALRETGVRDRLAGLGAALHAQDEVLVDRTDDEDVCHEGFSLLTQKPRDLGVDHHFEQVRSSGVQCALDGGKQVHVFLDQLAFDAETPRDADEVYPLHVEPRYRIPRADGVAEAFEDGVTAVVDDDKGDFTP